ncbi:MAG: hypothetical protein HW415_604 [Deltaproteobacteria bacterium]|nr:hypothetical protein [Deltaproteobacteria bacterium]
MKDQKKPEENRKSKLYLRDEAEEKLAEIIGAVSETPAVTYAKLVHELQVHQFELEVQNEELKRAELSLEESRDKYLDLYDFAPVGYFTINHAGRISEVNLTGAKLLGGERKQLIDKGFAHFVAPDNLSLWEQHQMSVLKSEGKQGCELTLRREDYRTFYARLESIRLEDSSGTPLIRTVVSDITELKKAEDALRNAQRLESLNVLAGGIAHDFNNLLNGIYGYIFLAKEESKAVPAAGFLEKALNTLNRARGLTNQLITFAKGGDPLPKTGALFPFIKDTALFSLSGSAVSCRFNIPDNLWLCNFDEGQISQVISNLVINAKEAMPMGGSIEISARNAIIGAGEHAALPQGNYVKVSIKDSGVGMPEKTLSRIFDPFFSTKEKGSGLGLALSYSIVKRHGGFLGVESEPGKGSTFHIYLPASKNVNAAAAPLSGSTHKGAGRILLMDDEDFIRESLGHILESMGYSVMGTKDGQEALNILAEEEESGRSFVAVILDLTVKGGMGGREAIAEIRKLNPGIPVFVSSGYSEDPVISRPNEYGFTDSICKPFNKSELAEMLNRNMV